MTDDQSPDAAGEVRRLEAALADRDAQLRCRDTELANALTRLAQLDAAVASPPTRALLRATRFVGALRARAAPPSTRRALAWRRAHHLAAIVSDDGVAAAIRYARERRSRLDPAAVSPPTPDDEQYRRWLRRHDPSREQLETMRATDREWRYRPLVSILVPVYNPEVAWLEAMVDSVLAQAYENWELCLADDLSTAPHVRPALSEWAARDRRIKVAFRTENGNIAAASNTALAMATGEFVALLDHDDVLRPHALHKVIEVLQEDEQADLVYSDEDKILVGGARGQVHFKGGFDPEYLLSTNYICHLTVLRREVAAAVGRFRVGFEGSQDHDLVLRVSERARSIHHVADVLYSWKQVPGSAALVYSEKPTAWEAGRRAVDEALARREPGARADFGPGPGLYVARYPVPPDVGVTVIMLADSAAQAAQSLAALRRAPGLTPRRWIIAGHDEALTGLCDSAVEAVVLRGSAHRTRLLNELIGSDGSDIVVLLGGDLAPVGPGPWLDPLIEQGARSVIGVVGGRIAGADGGAEQEGVHVGEPGGAASIGVRLPVIQQVSAVSADCMAFDRHRFTAAAGFDERYRLSLYDVDLCLRLRRDGYRTVYTPLTNLRRLHRRVSTGPTADDRAEFRAVWEHTPQWTDPFVSPFLERLHPFQIRDV